MGLEEVRKQYPTLAWLFNDPEVGPLLRKATDLNAGFDATTFQAKLYQTNWFRRQSQTMREASILQHTDPGSYRQNVNGMRVVVAQQAARLGVRLTPAQITWLSADAYRRGMTADDPRIAYGISQLRTKRNTTAGGIRTAARQARNMASGEYYHTMSTSSAAKWGDWIARGVKTPEDLQASLQGQAAGKYPHLRERILAGETPNQIAQPFREIIAQELELNPETIDMAKSRWAKTMDIYDPKMKQHRTMSNYEVMVMAREDPRFWRTQHGQEMDASAASFIAQKFGLRA